ncbi:Protein obstructor-E [Chionoecetes opilio]|uniref:Protein obstructor-E n=1 Tax=Chionoecetes opilio TaxID=41210 RepID=A0A8J4XKT0_CHIOP|nr:Protein obstructor-E [Chionoecetes opilio]
MRILLGAAFLCATAGIAAGQYADPCKTKTRTSAHEDQCDLYYECLGGQAILQECPNGLVYHGKRVQGLFGVCDYTFNVDCLAQNLDQPNPCDSKARIVADITYCDRYWECVVGNPQLYDCPNGLVFVGRNRGIAESCDYPWRGPYCDRKQLANPPITTEHCDFLYGIFGHETSCTRYWTCWNGTFAEQFCIGGLLYNEETHACDWPQNVNGCQKHPLCKDDPNANVPLGKSCERYWSCQGGYPRLQRCPATLVFDKSSRRCLSPPTLDCEAPTTTPAPEGSLDFLEQRPPRPTRRRPVSVALSDPVQDQGPFRPNNALRPSNARPQGSPLRPSNARPQGSPLRPSNARPQSQPQRPSDARPQSQPQRPSDARPLSPLLSQGSNFQEAPQDGNFREAPQDGNFREPPQGGNFREAPIAKAVPLN